jgi:hypothetical protein
MSSQDKIVLNVNPSPFLTPHHQGHHSVFTPLVVSNPDLNQSNNESQSQLGSPTSHSTSLLERLWIGRSLAGLASISTGGRHQSLAAISIVSTDEEMTLLYPPYRLTNTPTDNEEEEALPGGWTRQIWVLEQVEGITHLCRAILHYRQANPLLSDAMKTWTDDLVPAINALSYVTGQEEPLCNLQKYNKIIHLAWVPAFVNLINLYYESPTDEAPMLLIATPSQLSVVDTSV